MNNTNNKLHILAVRFFVLSTIFFVGSSSAGLGQGGYSNVGIQGPNAASLGKYGDVPVSLYNGIPQISIPITTLKSRSLELPVSLDYHASGIKVEEIPSWVGLGWSLNAGGVVTRTVKGIPDDQFNGYLYSGSQLDRYWPNKPEAFDLGGDMEPDDFFFNFGGRSGRMVLGAQGVYAIPYQDIRIGYDAKTTSPKEIYRWTFTTEEGTQYVFETLEISTMSSKNTYTGDETFQSYISSWYLTKIISADLADTINLSYTAPQVETSKIQNSYGYGRVETYYPGGYSSSGTGFSPAMEHTHQVKAVYLQSISSPVFVSNFSTSSRTDCPNVDGTQVRKKLDQITTVRNSQEVQRFVFSYSYFSGGERRLRLDTFREEIAGGGMQKPAYKLEYETTVSLPHHQSFATDHWGYYNGKISNCSSIPFYLWKARNNTEIKDPDCSSVQISRDPDPSFVQAGMLTKVTYPTGGFTQFSYEANDYSAVGTTHVPPPPAKTTSAWAFDTEPPYDVYVETPFTIGGNRSTNVTINATFSQSLGGNFSRETYDLSSSTIEYAEVRFLYADGRPIYTSINPGDAQFTLPPGAYRLVAQLKPSDPRNNVQITAVWQDAFAPTNKIAGGVRIKTIRSNDGIASSNDKVSTFEYRLSSDPTISSGVLVREPYYFLEHHSVNGGYHNYYLFGSSSSKAPLGTTQGGVVGYREVIEKFGTSGEFGKIVHSYRSPVEVRDGVIDSGPLLPNASVTSFDWKRGQELLTKKYSNTGVLVEQTSRTYTFDATPYRKTYKGMAWGSESVPMGGGLVGFYCWSAYEVISGWGAITSEAVTTYDQDGQNGVTKTRNYFYESPSHVQLTKAEETNSDGVQRLTEYKYASEKYDGMNSSGKHMISQLYSTTVKTGTSDVESKKWTLWRQEGNNWRPNEEWVWKGDGSTNDPDAPSDPGDAETYRSLRYDQYDGYGHLQQSTDANGYPTAIKYSYDSAVPVAVFKNASNAKTFVDEFGDGVYTDCWSQTDRGGGTTWKVENGMLKQTNPGTAPNEIHDRILHDLGSEITDKAVFEFDLRIADSDSYNLTIAMGGDGWLGGDQGSEKAIWSAIENENWYYYDQVRGWRRIISGLTIGRTYHFKIVANVVYQISEFYVDGRRLISDGYFCSSTTGIQKISFGNYGYGGMNSTWYIDNVRLYPASAMAVSASYDPITLNVNQIQDENGNVKFFNYDGFGRLTKEFARIDGSQELLREHRYEYSRSVGDVFDPSRPNSLKLIQYDSPCGNFSTSAGWGYYGDVTFNVQNAGETTVRMGTQYGDWNYIYKSAGSGHRIARVDFYPDNTTGSVPHVIAFDDGSWRFCVIYNATGGWWAGAAPNTFVVQDARNGWSSLTYAPISNFSAPRNRWYTVEIEKTDGGEMYAFVYPMGEGRIYSSGYMHHTTGFPSNWSANVLSWSNTDYYYLANHYVGLPDHGETFFDGLGRTLQEQHQHKNASIVSANTTYDPVGRLQKKYKAYNWILDAVLRLQYDPNYQDHASADYPNDAGYPFAEIQYLNDPLNRPQKLGNPGPAFRIGSGNEVQLQYGSNADGNVGVNAVNTLLKCRKIDEDGKITDTFTDKLGQVVGSTVDPGTLNLKTTFTYDVMGNMTRSTAPNNLSTMYLYTSLQQLRTKTSPDAGTVQYLYDRNGNLRLIKDANHGGSSANNFYQSSTIFSPYSTSGQFTIALPGKVTVSTGIYRVINWESVTVQIKQSGVVLCSTSSSGWNGSSNSVYLPAGTYDYVVTTSGWYGVFQYTINATTGLEFAYNKYDALNRIIETGQYESSSAGSFTPANAEDVDFPRTGLIVDKSFLYDVPSGDPLATTQRNLAGRVSMARSYNPGAWVSSTIYSYNDLGYVEWILQRHSGRTWKIAYEYDLQGRTTKKSFADCDNGYGLYTFYEYDQVGRLARVYTDTDVNGVTKVKEAEYTYTATSKPSRLILGNGAQDVRYAYNERDFVRQISAGRFYENLYYHQVPSYLAGYAQKNGNIAAIEWNTNQAGLLSYGFSYDRANRLEAAQTYSNSGISNQWMINSIRYDGAGNILSMNRHDQNGAPMDILTYTYESGKNRLNYIDDGIPSDIYTTDIDDQSVGNYIYDPNGNLLRDIGSSISRISYGVRNLPVSLIKNGVTYNYSYDASDARIHSSGSSKYYVNGANGQTEAVVDVTNPGVITHNIWGNDLVGQVRRNGSLTRYYHLKDHLGSVRVTVDASGNSVAYDDYDPWGMLMDGRSYNAGQADARYKFVGNERDVETGFDHLGDRSYDSRIGRLLSVDPFASKDPSRSPYSYAANNPIVFVDVNGDSVDVSQLTSKQRSEYEAMIEGLMESENFAEAYGQLVNSKSVYTVIFGETENEGASAQYKKNSAKKGSGGVLTFSEFSQKDAAHEIFHAYQHNERDYIKSYGREVEAFLFQKGVMSDVHGGIFSLPLEGSARFNQAFENLLLQGFKDSDWRTAIKTFDKSIYYQKPLYGHLGPTYYANPLIKRFYPLIK